MPLCFAYGSNMDLAAMGDRCPASRSLGVARLPRHRFRIAAEGYASVARDPRRTVYGLLWDIALADMPVLDRYEEVATGLYGKIVQSVLTERGPRRALVYVARRGGAGRPRPGYMEGVLAAAEVAGLPASYRRELAAWLPKDRSNAESGPARDAKVRPLFRAPTLVRPSGTAEGRIRSLREAAAPWTWVPGSAARPRNDGGG
jgi:hypothetical protein